MYVSDKCLVLYNRHRTIRNARRIGNLVSDSSSKRYLHKHTIYTYKHTHTHTHVKSVVVLVLTIGFRFRNSKLHLIQSTRSQINECMNI